MDRPTPSRRTVLAGAGLTTAAATLGVAGASTASAAPPPAAAAGSAARAGVDLGPHVTVFTPDMPAADVQAALNDALARLEPNSAQFVEERRAFLFAPGTYDVNAQIGYYTTVHGLGASPRETVIGRGITVWAQDRFTEARSSLQNFWRGAENLTSAPKDADGAPDATWWAVSQAAPLRRVHVVGQLGLFDYLGGFASGGFLADALVDSTVINAPQQQWLTRDSSIGSWSNGVWNQVFAGVEGAPPTSFPDPPYTTLDTNPLSREKPFLYLEADGSYAVFKPAPVRSSRGATWTDGQTPGTSIPLSQFFVAQPHHSLAQVNAALASGQHLLLTPGVYRYRRAIQVRRAGTVVLGIGMATVEPTDGDAAFRIADAPGIVVAGVLIDAGEKESDVLVSVGPRGAGRGVGRWFGSNRSDPLTLSDVFFRIGGAHAGRAKVSLEVNSSNVLLDHLWVWRADHGTGVGWTVNTAANGVVVDGDDVVATGLFVEHYQEYQVVWNGERGTTVLFQNEMPYDPPDQAAYRHDGVDGWASYKVADGVKRHEAFGVGAYCFFNVDPTIHNARGFEVPETPGVVLHSALTISLNGAGVIDHVVNDTGAATPPGTVPVDLVRFPTA